MAAVPAASRLRRATLVVVALVAFGAGAVAAAPGQDEPPPPAAETTTGPTATQPPPTTTEPSVQPALPQYPTRPSRALGRPWAGRLAGGVQLPAEGLDYVTWDPALKRTPDRGWRRWGTDKLVRLLLQVLGEYRVAHPDAPRVVVGDLSRPHGGGFGARFGGLGHMSHQNGLDVDVYYPRRDRLLRAARRPDQIDKPLARALLWGFLQINPQRIFIGPHTALPRPRRIVRLLVHHDDHMHVRIRP